MKKGFVFGFLAGVVATIGSSALYVFLYDHDFFRSGSKKRDLDIEDLDDDWLDFEDDDLDDEEKEVEEEKNLESLKDSSL